MRSAAVPRAAAVFAVPLAVLLAGTVPTACGGSPDRRVAPSHTSGSSAPADHNAADAAFAHNMLTDNEQAVQMAQMVPTNTTNPQVIALAAGITTDELQENQAFRNFLMQWQDVQGGTSASSGDGSGKDIPTVGAVDATTMNKLQSLTGGPFDRLWLTSMVDHHRGAIAMAQDEVTHGRHPDVIYMARSVIATQQPEMDQMTQMLGG